MKDTKITSEYTYSTCSTARWTLDSCFLCPRRLCTSKARVSQCRIPLSFYWSLAQALRSSTLKWQCNCVGALGEVGQQSEIIGLSDRRQVVPSRGKGAIAN
jgi:hypothetical protein